MNNRRGEGLYIYIIYVCVYDRLKGGVKYTGEGVFLIFFLIFSSLFRGECFDLSSGRDKDRENENGDS